MDIKVHMMDMRITVHNAFVVRDIIRTKFGSRVVIEAEDGKLFEMHIGEVLELNLRILDDNISFETNKQAGGTNATNGASSTAQPEIESGRDAENSLHA